MTVDENMDGWLCRRCNTLNPDRAQRCVCCDSDRPVASDSGDDAAGESLPDTVIRREGYSNAAAATSGKYDFRESVLVTAADIILILGLFCTFAAIISPTIINGVDEAGHAVCPWTYAIIAAIVLFAFSMITWALLRTVADISRRLRTAQRSDSDR